MMKPARFALLAALVAVGVLMIGGVALAATIKGTPNADKLYGTEQADNINPFNGDDYVDAKGGDDYVHHSYGNDKIIGVLARTRSEAASAATPFMHRTGK
jgi:Ca2+-binding RTX toxin-like protein